MQITGPKFPTYSPELNSELLEQYRNEGYIALENVLSPEEVEASKAALSELFQRIVLNDGSLKEGKFWNSPDALTPHKFFIQYEPGYRPDPNSTVEELELKLRKLMWFTDQHPVFEFLVSNHPVIRNVIETLLGDRALLYQDMALVKPPFIGSEKPWHQDNAYFEAAPLDATIGCWIALDEATVENGCMHVLPGRYDQAPLEHYHGFDCQIVESKIEPAKAVPVELKPGGAMFFSGLLPHQTPPNSSPLRRRALQFHYRAARTTVLSKEEYDRVFVDKDGVASSCYAAGIRRKQARQNKAQNA
jgi:phytanoyl-CoA hydroxylase